jgi:formylglycine-generating enzyme required for sulfatase activity
MVYIPPCRITLGPDPSDPDVSPAYTVELAGYWIDRYPVTVAQYAEFLNRVRSEPGTSELYHEFMANPDHCGIRPDASGVYRVIPGRERHPIVYVTHGMATAYAEWVGKKLPTEAQWERCARGLHGRPYPWGDEPIDRSRANYDFHYGGTTEVGSFPAGATDEGIFDLCGTVNEWCRDLYDAYPGGEAVLDGSTGEPLEYTGPEGTPVWKGRGIPTECLERLPAPPEPTNPVQRGGGWTVQPANAVSARRDADSPETWNFALGFRCVKEENP